MMAHQEIDQKVEVEHEHALKIEGVGGLVWIFALGVLFCMAFESEIRCSLGNQAVCVKMTQKAVENKSPPAK